MKKEFGDYYLGFDMGTNSVGWAVTDVNYKLAKLNGKALWGIRLFETAETAAKTRIQRTARRRLDRKTWRINMLRDLFAETINVLDPVFFMRLDESNLQYQERSAENKEKYNIFIDKLYNDVDFHKKYPTTYHLRQALIKSDEKFDVRLVYLALAHILKHRGHFLFEGLDATSVTKFTAVYMDLENYVRENLVGFEEWGCQSQQNVEVILKNRMLGLTQKTKALEIEFNSTLSRDEANKVILKQGKTLVAFLSGAKRKLSDLFADEALKECEKDSFSFADSKYEEIRPLIEPYLGERVGLVDKLKAIYDWSLLVNILRDNKYISDAKVSIYEEHKEDLRILKELVKPLGKKVYDAIFGKPVDSECNYSMYISLYKNIKDKKQDNPQGKAILTKGSKKVYDQVEFCKFLKTNLEKALNIKLEDITQLDASESEQKNLLYKIGQGLAFPKQTTKDNGVIPMQIHRVELTAILNKAEVYLPFLKQIDDSGLSVKEKIIKIMNFRIPYYVGPLNGTEASRAKNRCWVVRNTSDKIYPWNFDQVIDKKACAEAFINKMTNQCTYLKGEDVLPKNSLLYAEFMARNELNNLSVDTNRLPVTIIQNIYDDLLVKPRINIKLTKKKIADYLKTKNIVGEISGIDEDVKANLKAYKDFRKIFGANYIEQNRQQIEDIIKWITIFGEEKTILVEKIKAVYPEIDDSKLKEIKKLKYSDWGRLSKKLLNSSDIAYVDEATGEYITIIAALRKESLNFMELLGQNCIYGFGELIKNYNKDAVDDLDNVTYQTVEGLYVSPAVRRAIWQTISITKEIKKIMGHNPKKIFIEVAREEGAKQRTKSRLDRLKDLYKKCKEEERDWASELNALTEENLRSNKLYLYYTQMGRSMYTGEKIDLQELYDLNKYDKDHIYPRSKTKDDSLDNLVLVEKNKNSAKDDHYPLSPEIQHKMLPFWKRLLKNELISQKKFDRLTRKTPLTDVELAGFISRQLVETRQSTKAVAELLEYECKGRRIVYAKAGNVSDFRQEFASGQVNGKRVSDAHPEFIKCREVNDYHHAKDAYLNIVVGNVYDTRFTRNPLIFINKLAKGERYTLNPDKLYQWDIKRGDEVAWVAGDQGTVKQVSSVMKKNNILFTRYQVEGKGQLYDVNVLKKNKGQVPIKKDLPIAKYGGYNSAETAYFLLVQSLDKKGKPMKTIETMPIYLAKQASKDKQVMQNFLEQDCNLREPHVLLEKIHKFALLNINGYYMHLTGKTGNQLIGYGAVQLLVAPEQTIYLKKVCKFVAKVNTNKDAKVSSFDGITTEENLKIYKLFIEKHKNKQYHNRPAGQIKTLEVGIEKFIDLTIEEQCRVLVVCLGLFSCKSVSLDLKLIGGSGSAGTLKLSKTVQNITKDIKQQPVFKLINQSVTGIFEQEIDLISL